MSDTHSSAAGLDRFLADLALECIVWSAMRDRGNDPADCGLRIAASPSSPFREATGPCARHRRRRHAGGGGAVLSSVRRSDLPMSLPFSARATRDRTVGASRSDLPPCLARVICPAPARSDVSRRRSAELLWTLEHAWRTLTLTPLDARHHHRASRARWTAALVARARDGDGRAVGRCHACVDESRHPRADTRATGDRAAVEGPTDRSRATPGRAPADPRQRSRARSLRLRFPLANMNASTGGTRSRARARASSRRSLPMACASMWTVARPRSRTVGEHSARGDRVGNFPWPLCPSCHP